MAEAATLTDVLQLTARNSAFSPLAIRRVLDNDAGTIRPVPLLHLSDDAITNDLALRDLNDIA